MKKSFKKILEQYPSLKLIGNRYIVVLIFFGVWILFLDDASLLQHTSLNKEIKTLESNKMYYKDEIKKDKEQIKELNNIEKIEYYAREKYYMQRPQEDVYIIEYENDTIK